MMPMKIRNRMYRNIALLIFLLLTSIVAAFANEADKIPQKETPPISSDQPSQNVNMINL